MLLDTGSPGLMISPQLANRLGLMDGENGRLQVMTAGIGGSAPAMLAVVESVRVGEALAEFLPATITKIPSSDFEGLVGMDFMANYKIGIDTEKNVISFDELPPQADRPGGHDKSWWRSNFKSSQDLDLNGANIWTILRIWAWRRASRKGAPKSPDISMTRPTNSAADLNGTHATTPFPPNGEPRITIDGFSSGQRAQPPVSARATIRP